MRQSRTSLEIFLELIFDALVLVLRFLLVSHKSCFVFVFVLISHKTCFVKVDLMTCDIKSRL